MLRRLILPAIAVVLLGAAAFWWLTIPSRLDVRQLARAAAEAGDAPEAWVAVAGEVPPHVAAFLDGGDAAKGESVFHAGGCASCHAAPGAKGEAKMVLSGGLALETEFGTFHAPNISSDAEAGIGGWTGQQFVDAMKRGVSPDGRHYYPSFPYTSYARMRTADVVDLWAYMKTLPADATVSKPHDLGFPYTIRRGLGLWKLANLSGAPVTPPSEDPVIERGRYLVEGAGHCGECHTPRDWTGGLDYTKWLVGAPSPEGKGKIPAIDAAALVDWSAEEIVEALTSGFTPEFDSLGGSMTAVVENTAQLSAEDRAAMAAYLKSLPKAASR